MAEMVKMFLNNDDNVLIKHTHGTYMVVDARKGKNIGWWYGNPVAEGFKYVGLVPDGVAGGAMTYVPLENLLTIRAELFAQMR